MAVNDTSDRVPSPEGAIGFLRTDLQLLRAGCRGHKVSQRAIMREQVPPQVSRTYLKDSVRLSACL